ncbi:MAG: FKBP-type peptidyl-prolyl cis-trans isomerase [Runella sp.]
MRRVKLGLWLLTIFCGIIACEQTEEAFQDRKTRENRAEIREYLQRNGLRADSLRTGLFFSIQNNNPNAQRIQTGDEVTFRYVARRLDGVVIDSSQRGVKDMFIRAFGLRDLTDIPYRFVPVPSLEEIMSPPFERIREGDKVTLLVPWSLRSVNDVSLRAPLYIPIRYDLEILNVRSEEEQIEDFIRRNNIIGIDRSENGLRFLRTKAFPDSAQVRPGDEVRVVYRGKRVSDGRIFDEGTLSSVGVVDPTGNAQSSVVRGFNDGIARLRYGEKAILIFPSALGYAVRSQEGRNGRASIPAYSPLYFEVEVLRKQ